MANIKEFIIDTTATNDTEIAKKKSGKKAAIRYETILVSGCDFVIKRYTSRTEKTLCIIVSQDQYYIKNDSDGGDIEMLTENNIKSFFSGVRVGNPFKIADKDGNTPSWIDKIDGEQDYKVSMYKSLKRDRDLILDNLFWHSDKNPITYKRRLHELNLITVASVAPDRKEFCKALYDNDWRSQKNKYHAMARTVEEIGDELTRRYGVDGLRQFAIRYFDSPIDSMIGLYSFKKLMDAKPGIKFSDFADYIFEEGVRQGYANDIQGFINSWADYLNAQKTVYGKIKTTYSKCLATDEMIVSYEARKIAELERNEKLSKIGERLADKGYENDKYFIKVPQSASDFVEEGRRMSNCIAGYVDRVANGDCDIFFIREKEKPDCPLADLEIVNGEIVQLRTRFNKQVTCDVEAFAREFVRAKYAN